jgi:hypothetical protein
MHRPARSILPVFPILLAAFGAPAAPAPSASDPYVTLSWDHTATTAQQIVVKSFAGPGPYDVYVSLTGQSVPVRAFELVLEIGEGNGSSCYLEPPRPLAAAFRFDDAGCARGQLCYEASALVPPPHPGGFVYRRFLTDLTYNGGAQANILTYVEDDSTPLPAPDPTKTYRLAHFHLDLSGACAGATDSVYVRLDLAHWLDAPTQTEFVWNVAGSDILGWNTPPLESVCARKGPIEPSFLGRSIAPTSTLGWAPPVTEGAIQVCDAAVPARAASWGRVKATYR